MQSGPSFKNLMNMDKEKISRDRDRSRSKSPNDRSVNRSANKQNNRSINKSKLSAEKPSRIEVVKPINTPSTIPVARGVTKPLPSLARQGQQNNQDLNKISQLQNKIQMYQLQFKNHQKKLNQMFTDVPHSQRFQNQETQILSQSRIDLSDRISRLEEKLSKPLFSSKSMTSQFANQIQRINNPSESPLSTNISSYRVNHNYSKGVLNLDRLEDKLDYLESLLD